MANSEADAENDYLPRLKYWLPTIVSIVGATAAIVWFFFSVINPIENDILLLKNNGMGMFKLSPEVVNSKFLVGTDGTNLTKKQKTVLNNVIYQLQQRNDLVLIIAGYTNNYTGEDQFEKAKKSNLFASNIRGYVLKRGIDKKRIFYNGYGQNVPLNFPKNEKNNVGLLLVDLFFVMQSATY